MRPTGHIVSPERLEEFRRIYKETYSEDIIAEEAAEMTSRVLALYDILSRPMPAEHPRAPAPQAQRSSEAP